MKYIIKTSIILLAFMHNTHAQDTIYSVDYTVPKFSVGYTLGTHMSEHPSHLFAFEYTKNRKEVFKLELGYIYKDKLYKENDPEVDDYGYRLMATYMKKSSLSKHWFHGGGILYRKVKVGNIGGIPDRSGKLELGEYYLNSTLVGGFHQLSYKLHIYDRLDLNLGGRFGLGNLSIKRDNGVDPDYEKGSPGYGSGIFRSDGDFLDCLFFCNPQDVGLYTYLIYDYHITLSYALYK